MTGGGPPAPVAEDAPRGRRRGRQHGLRVGTGVAVAVVALLAFKLGTVTSLVLRLVVVTFAAGEAFAALRRAGYHPATLLGLVGTIVAHGRGLQQGRRRPAAGAGPVVVFTMIWYLAGVERGRPWPGRPSTLFVFGWVGVSVRSPPCCSTPSLFPDRHGIAFLLGAVIATVANDVGALVVGRWIGTPPVGPDVSPNKTWEGLAGGAWPPSWCRWSWCGAIHPWTPANAALLGLVVAVVAPLGRPLRVPDQARPRAEGHGPAPPRPRGGPRPVDGLLFVLPATYYLVRALNLG